MDRVETLAPMNKLRRHWKTRDDRSPATTVDEQVTSRVTAVNDAAFATGRTRPSRPKMNELRCHRTRWPATTRPVRVCRTERARTQSTYEGRFTDLSLI